MIERSARIGRLPSTGTLFAQVAVPVLNWFMPRAWSHDQNGTRRSKRRTPSRSFFVQTRYWLMRQQLMVFVAIMATGCSAGYAGESGMDEEFGEVSELLLASECADEAAAVGATTDSTTCTAATLWQSPILFEKVPGGVPAALQAAMDDWSNMTGGLVTFQELPSGSTVTPRVRFADNNTCSSPIGRVTGGVQVVNLLNPGCGNWEKRHELGHMLGFPHTQLRADRDRYIDVRQPELCHNANNSSCPAADPFCVTKEHFRQVVLRCNSSGTPQARGLIGPYDTNSIMHYDSIALTGGICTPANTSGCDLVRKSGTAFISPAASVSATDASNLVELYRAQDGWRVFQPIAWDDPLTQPLDTRLASGVNLVGDSALARFNTSDLAVLARGSDNHIYYKVNPGADDSWPLGAWTSLGGDFISDPAAVSWAPNRLDVVSVGSDGNIWHSSYLNGTWSGWGSIGKPTAATPSAPTIASWGANRLDIFVQAGGTLYHKTWDGAWSAWTSRGSGIKAKPAAVSWGANRIDVVAVGTDDQLYHQSYAGVWSGFGAIGGNVATGTGPAIASQGANLLNIYVKGSNGRVWHKSWGGSWSAFVDIGGAIGGSPAAFTSPAGRAHVTGSIFNGATGGVWHRYWG